jgi:hypothetical protein
MTVAGNPHRHRPGPRPSACPVPDRDASHAAGTPLAATPRDAAERSATGHPAGVRPRDDVAQPTSPGHISADPATAASPPSRRSSACPDSGGRLASVIDRHRDRQAAPHRPGRPARSTHRLAMVRRRGRTKTSALSSQASRCVRARARSARTPSPRPSAGALRRPDPEAVRRARRRAAPRAQRRQTVLPEQHPCPVSERCRG